MAEIEAYVEDFPGCCQARVICDFYYDEADADNAPLMGIPKRTGRIEFASTIPNQKKAAEALLGAGFRPFAQTRGGHGNYRITFWVRGDKTLRMIPMRRAKQRETSKR